MTSVRAALAVVGAAAVLAGCAELTPVPPPEAADRSLDSATSVARPANPGISGTASETTRVTVRGFSAYEKAALRVRNVGCGGVSTGSGFAITKNVLVTNRHVVAGADALEVTTYDGTDIEVTLAGATTIADLAIVRTEDELPYTLPLASANPTEGTKVTVVGYPKGGPLTTSSGKVLAYGPDPAQKSELDMLINDAPIEPGSSGSPLVDANGEIVGVAYGVLKLTDRNYAVPVEVLESVLNDPSSYESATECE